jgi:exodeoxyribonuclease-1
LSFVFFDTETTGLNYGFDQIVHFAAIRTDSDLNEIDRFEVRSRLLPHIVPHPGALRTNGLSIARLVDPDLSSHYDMICVIRQRLLKWSPTIFAGYNSIRFDEEMLRQALFQALYPAFLTSNHGNCRADVLSLVMAASALTPICLSVPTGSNGRPTFRLDQLAQANGIPHDRAHDAMADVAATFDLCRRVREHSSELWQRFVRFSKKATVADFVEAEDGFVLTEFFGNQAYHTPVVCIGRDPEQANGRLCLDLNVDPDGLAALTDDALQAELGRRPSPIRRLRVNAAPTVTALYEAQEQILNGLDLDEIEVRARRLKANQSLCARLGTAYTAAREPRVPSRYVEEQIYDGFPGPEDEGRMMAFHGATWQDRLAIVERFDDERLRTFGLRLIYFERRSVLPEKIRIEVERALTDRLVEDCGGALTLERALQETDSLLSEGTPDAGGLLADYRSYLTSRIDRVSEFRSRRFTN